MLSLETSSGTMFTGQLLLKLRSDQMNIVNLRAKIQLTVARLVDCWLQIPCIVPSGMNAHPCLSLQHDSALIALRAGLWVRSETFADCSCGANSGCVALKMRVCLSKAHAPASVGRG